MKQIMTSSKVALYPGYHILLSDFKQVYFTVQQRRKTSSSFFVSSYLWWHYVCNVCSDYMFFDWTAHFKEMRFLYSWREDIFCNLIKSILPFTLNINKMYAFDTLWEVNLTWNILTHSLGFKSICKAYFYIFACHEREPWDESLILKGAGRQGNPDRVSVIFMSSPCMTSEGI